MIRSGLAAAALFCASLAHGAIPPPVPPPPLPPEMQAAADAVAAAMPVEAALGGTFSGYGITARNVARLMLALSPPSRSTCAPSILQEHLAMRVAPRFPSVLPRVAARFRRLTSERVADSMSREELEQARAMIETPPGRALLLSTWGADLQASGQLASFFASALSQDAEALIRAAERDCRRERGRPPPQIM